jgi:hypothetical protein
MLLLDDGILIIYGTWTLLVHVNTGTAVQQYTKLALARAAIIQVFFWPKAL